MSGLYTFLFIIFALLAIIIGLIVHEFGHFIFARLFKVNVKEFSIGIGPKIFGKKTETTNFVFRPIPIMAYVMIDSKKLIGLYEEVCKEQKDEIAQFLLENKQAMDNGDTKLQKKYERLLKALKKYEYMASNPPGNILVDDIAIWKQIIIYLGGVLFNVIFFALFYVITVYGLAGVIATIEQQLQDKFQQPGIKLQTNPFVQLWSVIENLGKNMVFYNAWKPFGSPPSTGTIVGDGINFNSWNPTSEFLTYTIFNYFTIFNLVLFIFNILPIPPLDGFKVVTASLSKSKIIKISKKTENILTYSGIGLIGYIILTGIIADIIR